MNGSSKENKEKNVPEQNCSDTQKSVDLLHISTKNNSNAKKNVHRCSEGKGLEGHSEHAGKWNSCRWASHGYG